MGFRARKFITRNISEFVVRWNKCFDFDWLPENRTAFVSQQFVQFVTYERNNKPIQASITIFPTFPSNLILKYTISFFFSFNSP